MMRFSGSLLLVLGAIAALGSQRADPIAAPTGARIEPSGFATILSAPPVPYPDAPPLPPGEQETQRLAREQGVSVADAERMMNPDAAAMRAAQQLERRLRREAAGNYVAVRVIRDPRPRYQFFFRRDAAATLARFTRDPRFAAAEGGVPSAELEPIMQEWLRRFEPYRLASGGGTDPFTGTIEIQMGVSRAEFDEVADREAWQIPAQLRLDFAPEIDLASVVAADAAPFVRVFPRADRAPGMVLSIAQSGRIVLRDGCFRLNTSDGPLVLFGRNTRLLRDGAGYLAIASLNNGGVRGRIGEAMIWGGYPAAVEDEPGVRAIRAQCGEGPIVSVGEPESAASFRVRPGAISVYAEARGLSRQAAWDEIKACWAEQDAARDRPAAGGLPPPMRECDWPYPSNPPPPPPRR